MCCASSPRCMAGFTKIPGQRRGRQQISDSVPPATACEGAAAVGAALNGRHRHGRGCDHCAALGPGGVTLSNRIVRMPPGSVAVRTPALDPGGVACLQPHRTATNRRPGPQPPPGSSRPSCPSSRPCSPPAGECPMAGLVCRLSLSRLSPLSSLSSLPHVSHLSPLVPSGGRFQTAQPSVATHTGARFCQRWWVGRDRPGRRGFRYPAGRGYG